MRKTVTNLKQYVQAFLEHAPLEQSMEKRVVLAASFLRECKALKSTLAQVHFDFNLAEVSSQVRSVQVELTQLADHLYILKGSAVFNEHQVSDPDNLYEELMQELVSLLCYVKTNFPESFNTQLKAPAGLKDVQRHALAAKREFIMKILLTGQIDDELTVIISDYLSSIDGESEYTLISWRDFGYMENFINAFSSGNINASTAPDAVFQKLVRQLYFINFNATQFYDYSRSWIDRKIGEYSTFIEQRRELLLISRYIKQFLELPDMAYSPKLPSVKQMVSNYIDEEIEYLLKTENLHAGTFHNKARNTFPFYFHVNLTTAQLMFFVRLLLETGIIITKRKADLHEFISNHVGTLRKDNLSESSIKNKQYNPSREVVRRVKHLSLSLINIIHDRYTDKV